VTEVWQGQAVDPAGISVADVRRLARSVERAVRRRNRFGLLICAAEVLTFGGMWLAYPDATQRVGCTMTLVGLVYLSLQLVRRPAVHLSPAFGLEACLDFQRAELRRQRDFHRGWWFWSRLLLFVPGPLVFAFGTARVWPSLAVPVALVALVFAALAASAVPVNRRAVQVYQRQLDALTD
jgi:drug/metabolite transporter (DMT)-like permease